MRAHVTDTVQIDAPRAAVWAILTDGARYPEWNPFIKRLEGELRQGESLSVAVEPPGRKAMSFRPRVLVARAEQELRWLGRFIVPGIFDGEHAFELTELAGGRTGLTQSETFSGVLVRPMRSVLASTEEGFRAMNQALKERAEAAVSA